MKQANMELTTELLLVDDDPVNNLFCKLLATSFDKSIAVKTFLSPEDGLQYINEATKGHCEGKSFVLFLDINMPKINGWEFLLQFSRLDEEVKRMFSVFIVSSSVNPADKEMATKSPEVKDFFVKPMSRQMLASALSQ